MKKKIESFSTKVLDKINSRQFFLSPSLKVFIQINLFKHVEMQNFSLRCTKKNFALKFSKNFILFAVSNSNFACIPGNHMTEQNY